MGDGQQVDFSVSMAYVAPLERVAQIRAALDRWRRPALAGDSEAQFQLGRVFMAVWEELKKRRETEAIIASNAFPAANAGWQEAIDRYQPFYEAFDSDSVSKEVFKWLQLAAEQEHRDAQYALGTFLLMELPPSEENKASGRHWLEHAAEAGNAEAAYDLYYYLRSESGVFETDEAVGSEWLEKAALLGQLEAAKDLATPDYDIEAMSPTNVLRAYIWTIFLDATKLAESPERGSKSDLKARLTPHELRVAEQQVAALLQRWVDLAPLRHR